MKEKHARSVLDSYLGEVAGIVSKTDILFKGDVAGQEFQQGQAPGNNDKPSARGWSAQHKSKKHCR